MKKTLRLIFIISLVTSAVMLYRESTKTPEVNNIIFVIGDGMGLAQACTLDSASNFERAQNICFSKTYSHSNKVTDSAAGGTALACGVKTNNGMIGMKPDSTAALSVMDRLKAEKGISTGIVVSCELWHATPADFYAHNISRKNHTEITHNLYNSTLDVAIGGAGNIISADSLKAAGFDVCRNVDELSKADGQRVAGLLASNHLSPAPERKDTISLAVAQALRLLERNKKGFMLMIEGSQVDWAGHNNDGEYLKAEVADLNRVIGQCFDYADEHSGTLVIVTADHETGGLALLTEDKTPTFTTGTHSGVYVPVYLYGTRANDINGIVENIDLPEFVYKVMNKEVLQIAGTKVEGEKCLN